jgi:signal transduction histidine kinase
MTQRLSLRFEERLAERTRIAQELHDTLLQGFLSVSMQTHLVTDRLPADSPVKPALNRVIQLMGQVIDESRNTVRGLRASTSAFMDLEQAFSQIRHEFAPQGNGSEPAQFRVVVEGRPRPLHPLLRDEIYRIGREGLINAFRHARASRVELELKYSPDSLRLVVRDDGCGISPHVLRSGVDGHWGLSGMRERADRIGARLRLWSNAGAGTEVELTVPSHIAFADHRKSRTTLFGRYFRRGSGRG